MAAATSRPLARDQGWLPGTVLNLRSGMRLVAAILVGFCLLSTAKGVRAQDIINVNILAVDDSAFPEVTALVTADERGRPMSEAIVKVEETGSTASPISVTRAVDMSIPLALVVAVDVSGSMEGDFIDKARSAAISLIDGLSTNDRAAVVSFGDDVKVEQPLTNDKQALREAVARLRAEGSTALYDAVAASARVASESNLQRRAIVLLSDGKESGGASKIGRDESVAVAAASNSLFYVVGVGSDVDRPYLEELAARSGGRFFEAFGAAEVPAVYAALEELLRSQLVIRFRASSPPDLQDRHVRISLQRGTASGVAERDYRSSRLPAAPQDASPAPSIFVRLAALTGLMLVGAILFLAVKRRGRGAYRDPVGAVEPSDVARPVAAHDESGPLLIVTPARETAAPDATITIISGPGDESGRVYEVGPKPVTIGADQACRIHLSREQGIAAEHARVWWRDGRLMLHHLAPGYETMLGGRSVVWASVEQGDMLNIGPYVLQCTHLVREPETVPV